MNADFPASKTRLRCIFVEKFRYRCSFDPLGSSSTPLPSPHPTRDPTVSKNPSETLFEKIQITMFLWPRGVIQYTSALPPPETRPHCIEKPFRNTFRERMGALKTWNRPPSKFGPLTYKTVNWDEISWFLSKLDSCTSCWVFIIDLRLVTFHACHRYRSYRSFHGNPSNLRVELNIRRKPFLFSTE
jgi:hypothetical protein